MEIESAVRRMDRPDVAPLVEEFRRIGWNKPADLFGRCLDDQDAGTRHVLVAVVDDRRIGYVTVLQHSAYAPFDEAGIPEISDLNVLPDCRRRGVGSALMDAAEQAAADWSEVVGLGVGLFADYGPAQRLYVGRGYLPDGRGMVHDWRAVGYGQSVRIDDDALLMFTRQLPS